MDSVDNFSTVIVDNLNVGKEEAQEVKLSTVIVDNSVENCVEVP